MVEQDVCQLMSLSAPSTPFGMQWFKDDHQVDPAGEFDKRERVRHADHAKKELFRIPRSQVSVRANSVPRLEFFRSGPCCHAAHGGRAQPCARSDRRLGVSDIHRTLLGLVAPMKYP